VGDEVVLFGDPLTGAPSADDWGDAADTIGYEIVTRIGPRVHRTYVGGE
jgi:alanine racemase